MAYLVLWICVGGSLFSWNSLLFSGTQVMGWARSPVRCRKSAFITVLLYRDLLCRKVSLPLLMWRVILSCPGRLEQVPFQEITIPGGCLVALESSGWASTNVLDMNPRHV